MRLDVFIPPGDLGFDDPSFGFDDPSVGGATTAFSGVFGFVLVIVLIGFGFAIFVGVRKYLLLKRSGHDPFTVDAAIAAKLLNSDALRPGTSAPADAPARTVEQRLAEVDDLHTRGVISAEERSAARAAILGG